MLGNEGMIHRGRGLVDLIAGKTPTLSGWTNNPTDAADITDGDITTFCTTGSKVAAGGYDFAYFEWNLGAFYNVMVGGVLNAVADAGTAKTYVAFWNGSAWIQNSGNFVSGATLRSSVTFTGHCSKVHVLVGSSAGATTTPNIREFHVWRL